MKFLPHIAMQIYNTPLMIHEEKLNIILNVLGERIGLQGGEVDLASSFARPKKETRAPKKTTEIAVVPIYGTLIHRSTGFDSFSGLRSYLGIAEDFQSAIDDPKIDAILLDVDSPGGAVAGAFDLADRIYEAREKKPVYAYINEHGFSAAYLLASGARKIFMPRTGGVGSIGVRMVHVDMTEKDKQDGLEVTHLFVGDRKIDFDPHAKLSKEARDLAMKDLREMYDMFVDTVARNRDIPGSEIRGTEAGVYLGNNAVGIGLADEIMTFDEAVDFIVDDIAENSLETDEKEVSGMFKTLAELKTGDPGLYDSLIKEAKDLVRVELQATYDTQLDTLKTDLKDRDDRIKVLEKKDFIRANRENANRINSAADVVWTKAMANSDIPEEMHEKVRAMIDPHDFVLTNEGGEKYLDTPKFEEAVEKEISDWEDKGMKQSVLGASFGKRKNEKDSQETNTKAAEAKEDEIWLDHMVGLAEGKKGGE